MNWHISLNTVLFVKYYIRSNLIFSSYLKCVKLKQISLSLFKLVSVPSELLTIMIFPERKHEHSNTCGYT